MTVDELEMIAEQCRKHDVIVVSDEVYEWLVYPPQQHIRIGLSPVVSFMYFYHSLYCSSAVYVVTVCLPVCYKSVFY